MFSGGSESDQATLQWDSEIQSRGRFTPLGLENLNTKTSEKPVFQTFKYSKITVEKITPSDASVCTAMVSDCRCENCQDSTGFFWG